jgi:uronate dehydrogenase
VTTETLRIGITGGAGKVGTALRAVLSARFAAVRVIDLVEPAELLANESFVAADMSVLEQLGHAFEGLDGIIHLAGLNSERDLQQTLHVNVLGASNLYEAARSTGVGRVVLGSSNHAMGFYRRDQKVGGYDQMRPDTLYGLSKCWAELTGGLYFDKAGIRTLSIRIGNAQERPTTPRSLEIWISPGDLAQLCVIGLTHPEIDCTVVYGVSAGGGSWYDNSEAERLGYRPKDRIADFATPEAFVAQPVALNHVAETYQGGPFTSLGHDGIERSRRLPAR